MVCFKFCLLIVVTFTSTPASKGEPISESVYDLEDSSEEMKTFLSHYPPREDKGDIPRCQKDVVDILKRDHYIKSKAVADVMLKVDLKHYDKMYFDVPKYMGVNVVCSEQHHTAFALEMFKERLKPGNKALVTECGTGYLPVCMALMVGPKGYVVALEDYPPAFQSPTMHIEKTFPNLLKDNRVRLVVSNSSVGAPQFGPYDVINVGLMHLGLLPQAPNTAEILINQLNKGGRLLLPFRTEIGVHRIAVYDKDLKGKVTRVIDPGVFEVLNLNVDKAEYEKIRREKIDPEDPPQLS